MVFLHKNAALLGFDLATHLGADDGKNVGAVCDWWHLYNVHVPASASADQTLLYRMSLLYFAWQLINRIDRFTPTEHQLPSSKLSHSVTFKFPSFCFHEKLGHIIRIRNGSSDV